MDKQKTCGHCGTNLVEKATKRTPEQLKKSYYYTAYYFCPNCKRIYHDDKFKIINDSPTLFFANNLSSPTRSGIHKIDSRFRGNDNLGEAEANVGPDSIGVEIWTDGACVHNGTPKAKAAWAFVSGPTEKAGLVKGKQTNNTAEALAVYFALEWAAEKGFKNIKLHTDSQITIHGLNKSPHLVKSNQEIFQQIADVIEKNNLIVELVKVLGHSGDVNNERADRLANKLAGVKV